VERTQVLCRNTFSAVELVLTAGAPNWCPTSSETWSG